MNFDLHLHTWWSYDATTDPEGYFRRARELGLLCLAITDHHVTDSHDEVAAIAARYPEIRWVPSAELSVTCCRGAVDLLCYGLPAEPPTGLRRVLDAYRAWQQETGETMTHALQILGYDYTEAHRRELLESYRPAKTLAIQGYTHIKGAVLKDYFRRRGFTGSDEEHADLVKRAHGAAPFPPYPAHDFVVPAVKEAGGLVAIAHPFEYFAGCDRGIMDRLRIDCQLDGIECANGDHVPSDHIRLYREYCLELGLFSTAGSDCHADEALAGQFAFHGDEFAPYRGEDNWLDEFLARLDGG
jgi:predicted metal-dependent phosphoesterase TrpH